MTFTQVLVYLAENNCPLTFNLKDKVIKSGKKVLYENGKIVRNKITAFDKDYEWNDDLELYSEDDFKGKTVEELFNDYKYSVPDRYDSYKSYASNFRAVREDKLTNAQMMSGKDRGVCKVLLESFVMFKGKEIERMFLSDKHYFWKSSTYNDLVIFRDWV